MSIRRVTCPGCGAAANVPAAMAHVKCPACGAVWNAQQPSASPQPAARSKPPAAQAAARPEAATDTDDQSHLLIIGGIVAGAIMLLVFAGVILVILNREPAKKQTAATEVEETIKPATPQEYREIKLPEEARKRIYADYRKVAKTTVEKPLALPQGTKMRANMEDMLQKTFDRELAHFAALHDITVDDVKEVIKEGDAKIWDDSPRSNAVRGGKRVYPKEMSEGWNMKNPNRK